MTTSVSAFPVTFVVSGPGGVGKGTVVERLMETADGVWLSRSWTTRDPRPGEASDAYNFVTRDEFLAHVEAGGFLEWVEFLDYLQGTPMPTPPAGHVVILEIDIQGAAQIHEMNPSAHLVFIDTPSLEEQERRLRGRGDSEERVAMRMEKGAIERASATELGCTFIVNDGLDDTVAQLTALIEAAR
ncbi:MAG: guanylate kinase [Actinomycetota bacterium]